MRGSFADHLAAFGVKRGVQRKRPVPVILKAVALQPPGRQRQHRIEPVQGLNGGLFVHAKHCRMLRRFDVQPDNISRLEFEIRVVGGHVAFDPMRLESGPLPHPRDHHMANAQVAGQLAATPVGGAVGRRSAGPFQNLRFQCRSPFFHRPSTMARVQPGQPLSLEPPLPATDIVRVATEQAWRIVR